MNRLISIAILFSALLVFSGCSVGSNSGDAPATSSVWKSNDGGKNWQPKNKTNENISIDTLDVLNIAVNPYDSKNILVGTAKDGILSSEDGGESWSLLNFQSEKVYGLAVDSVDGRIVYASGVWQKRGKIFKSNDSGQNWQEIYTTPSAGPLVISLAIDKKNSNIIYVTTSDNQLIKSIDAGATWKNIFQASGPVLEVAIDSANGNLIYLNVLGGSLFRSRDGGDNFEDISKSISSSTSGISEIQADPNNGSVVYVAGNVGILRSRDAGNNWEKLKLLNDSATFPVKALAISPFNSNEITYGAAQAIYKSADGGATWTTSQFDTSKTINVLKYSLTDANVVYMGLSDAAK